MIQLESKPIVYMQDYSYVKVDNHWVHKSVIDSLENLKKEIKNKFWQELFKNNKDKKHEQI